MEKLEFGRESYLKSLVERKHNGFRFLGIDP